MPDHSKEMDPAIRTLILAERIDERTMALEEGVDRIGEDVESNRSRIQSLESTCDSYLEHGEAGLRRIIREEFKALSEQDSLAAFNKWATVIGLLISIAALAISFLL